ncbi:hypothetical protein [Streptomyces sp. NBC_01506]|uniref:hypothetical protein n=1 Tax=Streptomyces sp. NBC_01506 TaxID=2903887 RepID=UPI002F91BD69
MRTALQIALFLLTVLEMTAGVIAGVVALASLITEAGARVLSLGSQRVAAYAGLAPLSLRLRDDLATVLSTSAPAKENDR